MSSSSSSASASASSWASSAPALVLSFLAGGASVLAAAVSYLELVEYRQRKARERLKKNPVPSFLEAMYLYEKETGLGEEVPSTPRKDGFRMPAEWEPHSGCWLLFPHRLDNWREGAGPAQKAYAHVANAIQQHGNEQVTVGVRSEDWGKARALLDPAVRVVELASDDAWVRDSGPTFVVKDEGGQREVRGVDWGFNAYGGLYRPFAHDALLARKILEVEGVRRYRAPLVLEGGSIHVDGEGTCLATEECLLHPSRNPGMGKEEIEAHLKEYLNVDKVVWLERGVYGDEDTNGHIDNFCCFKAPGEVILHWTDDEADPQYERSWNAYVRLARETDARGRALVVHKMPMPGPLYYSPEDVASLVDTGEAEPRQAGERLAASYVNFYIANEAVVVPQFGVPTDEEALELFQLLFPERRVVGVYTRDVLLGGGNIHCITQQQCTNVYDAI